jgi:glucan phosphoethanolaminetransferase (alkaline phosphatase superfamily)
MMYWLAAIDWSKVTSKLPPDYLLKTGYFLLFVLVIVLIVRIFQSSNKIFLSISLISIVAIVFAYWIYNRNEPAFMTPIIEPISAFFPTKYYEKKDVSNLDNQKKAGNRPKEKK